VGFRTDLNGCGTSGLDLDSIPGLSGVLRVAVPATSHHRQIKSVPLQAWSGPEGSRKLKFPDIMTTAQGVGKVVSHTHWPHLPPGNSAGTHFC